MKGIESGVTLRQIRRTVARVATMVALAALAGCATLPSSGPTGRQIRRSAEVPELGFKIVDIDQAVIDANGHQTPAATTIGRFARAGRTDTVGPGDVLDIGIYEVGITLFSGSGAAGVGASFDPAAKVTRLGDVVVDANGTILLPYIGRLYVQGSTPSSIQSKIERGLRGKSQSPQALVSVKTNAFNTFYVSGDVRQPGRYTLGLPRERLLDALARAGGTTNQPNDMVVRITRGTDALESRLSEVTAGGRLDVPLLPGDRVELFNRPRTFLIFGATDKVSQVPFGASVLTLAEALARSGGPSDRIADPSAIFLFRQVPVTQSVRGDPVVATGGSQVSAQVAGVDATAVPLPAASIAAGEPIPPPMYNGAMPSYRSDPVDDREPEGIDAVVDTSADAVSAPAIPAGATSGPAPELKPVIYRLDMTRANAFFLSQRFELQDKDVIYIANARANAPTRLAQILGQLFSPFLAVRAVVGN